jgi:hypothetical protein
MPDFTDDKISEKEFYDLIDGFSLDMIAIFRMMEDEAMATLDRAIKEGWTPEKFVDELGKII